MKTSRTLIVLTIANFALLLLLCAERVRPALAQDPLPMLRGRGLEIVDSQGRVRASISVLSAAPSTGQDRGAETVLLRLTTERGRPSVKISASEPQSGLSFTGPTGTHDTYVILEAKGTGTSMTLRAESGREQVLKP